MTIRHVQSTSEGRVCRYLGEIVDNTEEYGGITLLQALLQCGQGVYHAVCVTRVLACMGRGDVEEHVRHSRWRSTSTFAADIHSVIMVGGK